MTTLTHILPTWRLLVVLSAFLAALPAGAEGDAQSKARKLYMKLTGTPLTTDNPLYNRILAQVQGGDLMAAADIITDKYEGSRFFYDTQVRKLAVAYNRNHSLSNSFNDLAALFICITRDDLDYKMFLVGEFRCHSAANASGTAYSEANNNHFISLDQNRSLRDTLEVVSSGFVDLGIFYTRQFALDAYEAGTNRRPWKWIIENLFLAEHTSVKSLLIPDGHVRRDVPRISSDGTTLVYRSSCRGCHGQMDPISNYFGVIDFQNGAIVRRPSFTEKIGEPGNNPVFQPFSTDGPLYFTDAQQGVFGFNDVPPSGEDAGYAFSNLGSGLYKVDLPNLKAFARVLAYSDGYARGLVTRIVTLMYLGKVWALPAISASDKEKLEGERETIERLTQELKTHKSLRKIFHSAAVEYLDSEVGQ